MQDKKNDSLQQKIEKVKKKFSSLSSSEGKYALLIEMGRTLPPFPAAWKTEEQRVAGCQSALYLHAELCDGKIFFSATADALISAGLAALLLSIYSGESPEALLKNPPHFLEELGIFASLSPSRSNGLAHLHKRMVQEALKSFVKIV